MPRNTGEQGSRLLTVSAYFDGHRGGVEIVAGRLAAGLARNGFSVTWAATGQAAAGQAAKGQAANGEAATVGAAVPAPNGKVLVLSSLNVTERRLGVPYPIIGLNGLMKLSRAVRDADVLLIHDGLYMTSLAALFLARRKRKPVVLVQHIGAVPYRNKALRLLMGLANATFGRWALATADQVVFISDFVRGYFGAAQFARPPELIFNGVDAEVFRPCTSEGERHEDRMRFGLGDGRVALFVGRFVEKKGLSVLRRAALMTPDITWILAGWGQIDPRDWRLPNVRVFEGLSGESLASLYRASDVFVLPSQGEGFPLVIQEALASGLSVVCGDEMTAADPAISFLLRTVKVGGRRVEDVAADTVRSVEAAFAADDRPLERAQAARTRYTWDAVVRSYVELIEQRVAGSISA